MTASLLQMCGVGLGPGAQAEDYRASFWVLRQIISEVLLQCADINILSKRVVTLRESRDHRDQLAGAQKSCYYGD